MGDGGDSGPWGCRVITTSWPSRYAVATASQSINGPQSAARGDHLAKRLSGGQTWCPAPTPLIDNGPQSLSLAAF